MTAVQPGILDAVPSVAKHLAFTLAPRADCARALCALSEIADGRRIVVGIGRSLAAAIGREVPGLELHPAYAGPGFEVPSTPAALWCWLRGDDRGELLHLARALEHALAPDLLPAQAIDAFRYGASLDLSGYEDGTENPRDDDAVAAAVVTGLGPGLDGSSFAAVQQWVHDLDRFAALSTAARDATMGRRLEDNQEIEDAPPSAHVKRTAQESFDPPAFVLRRSMPWNDAHRAGLVFLAFGRSFAAFDALLRRMVGAEDGIADGLFGFTRPVTGSYFWCPPVGERGLDLRALGL